MHHESTCNFLDIEGISMNYYVGLLQFFGASNDDTCENILQFPWNSVCCIRFKPLKYQWRFVQLVASRSMAWIFVVVVVVVVVVGIFFGRQSPKNGRQIPPKFAVFFPKSSTTRERMASVLPPWLLTAAPNHGSIIRNHWMILGCLVSKIRENKHTQIPLVPRIKPKESPESELLVLWSVLLDLTKVGSGV